MQVVTFGVSSVVLGLGLGLSARAQQLVYEIPAAGPLRAVADLDGDGVSELQIGFGLYSGVDGSFFFDTSVPSPGPVYSSPVPVGDLDGDGYPDVAFHSVDLYAPDPPVVVYSGLTKALVGGAEPQGWFQTVDFITWLNGTEDVDGDGVVDIVFGSKFLTLFGDSCYGYLSGGAFTPANVTSVGDTSWGSFPHTRAVLADFSGNGVSDALFDELGAGYKGVSYLGGASFPGLQSFGVITGAADVDLDGRADFLDITPPLAGPIEVRSSVDGSLLLSPLGDFNLAVGVGDIDCDGFEDFLASSSAGQRSVLFSGADAANLWETALGANHLARVGDLDGDGFAEWAVGSSAAGKTEVWTGPWQPPVAYCTGKVNSQGCTPKIDSAGVPTATGSDDFWITARDVLAGKPGLYFWGTNGRLALPFQGGTLCVQPPLQRGPVLVATGPTDCSSGYAFLFGQALAVQFGISPGATVNGQFWMRDPDQADGTGVGLSDALEFRWCL